MLWAREGPAHLQVQIFILGSLGLGVKFGLGYRELCITLTPTNIEPTSYGLSWKGHWSFSLRVRLGCVAPSILTNTLRLVAPGKDVRFSLKKVPRRVCPQQGFRAQLFVQEAPEPIPKEVAHRYENLWTLDFFASHISC